MIVETNRLVQLEVPPTISDADIRDALTQLLRKYGDPTQITVDFRLGDSGDSTREEHVATRKRILGIVMGFGYKHKHLSPFTAVKSSRYVGRVSQETRA